MGFMLRRACDAGVIAVRNGNAPASGGAGACGVRFGGAGGAAFRP